jgi:hypothetical protein
MGIAQPQQSNNYNHLRSGFSSRLRRRFKSAATPMSERQMSVEALLYSDGICRRKAVIDL